MKNTMQSVTTSINVDRDFQQVYAYLADPRNFPEWAPGLCLAIKRNKDGKTWTIKMSEGTASARFTPFNEFGIADHYVQLSSGSEIYIPMRVLVNDKGSEIVFTLYKIAGMNAQQFKNDLKQVNKDLKKLKEILESK